MSWSVSAVGNPAEVIEELDKQFEYPLRDAPAGLADEGEKQTARELQRTIKQCLGTFGPDQKCVVTASGHIGYNGDWEKKEGAYQFVTLSIGAAI